MALAREVQSGQISLQRPDGGDTVAKNLGRAVAQQVLPSQGAPAMGMQDALANAGIAGQIQAGQMQDAQQAVMAAAQQAAAQKNSPMLDPAAMGIATAPGAQGVQMAEGGIAGYAGDEESMVIDPAMGGSAVNPEFETSAGAPTVRQTIPESEVQRIADAIREQKGSVGLSDIYDIRAGRYGSSAEEFLSRSRPAAAAPKPKENLPIIRTAPAGVMSLPRATAPLLDLGLGETRAYRTMAEEELAGIDTAPPTSAQVGEQYTKDKAVTDALMRAEGLDPNYVSAAQEAEKQRTAARTAQAQETIDRLTNEQKRRRLSDFLLSAQGFQGEGIGQVLASGALGARAAGEARQSNIDRLRQAQLDFQDASAKEQFLMNKMRYETAMNRFDKARDTLQDLKKASNDKRAAGIRMYTAFAGDTSQEGIARAQMQSRADAANAAAASRMLAALTRGAGGKPTSPKDVAAREALITQNFFSPMAAASPTFRRYVPPEVLNDIAAGRIEFDGKTGRWIGPGKKPVVAIDRAAQQYEQALRAETTRGGGGGPTPYTDAESEVD